ncbi:hypothetical protein HRI_004695900 [Hibiscus trionum]|uniref:Reverse transcriptase n=1 Tax=Hibiscus trionum TaxID=183268 RepID=A0A9W7J8K2_HIBTR|nr:hypothetical protein HRI_004695900 [Hibiscus trionum]
MMGFRDMLEGCNLSDLGFNGVWYTWERGRLPETNVRERLDRAVANPSWWDMHQDYSVSHLPHSMSDHCPILIDTVGQVTQRPATRLEVFRFDANWIFEEETAQIIKICWETSRDAVPSKLHAVGCALMSWSKDHRKQRSAQKRAMVRRLKELARCNPDEEILAELTDVKLGLNLEADKEEYFWEQRSRSNWLHHGDKKYIFFSTTTQRTDLFRTSSPPEATVIFDKVNPRVTADMNNTLMRPFTKDEVWNAFESVEFYYIPRQSNQAAHVLAKEGKEQQYDRFWIEEAPPRTTAVALMDAVQINEE